MGADGSLAAATVKLFLKCRLPFRRGPVAVEINCIYAERLEDRFCYGGEIPKTFSRKSRCSYRKRCASVGRRPKTIDDDASDLFYAAPNIRPHYENDEWPFWVFFGGVCNQM